MLKNDSLYTIKTHGIWFWFFVLMLFSSIFLTTSYAMRVSKRLIVEKLPEPTITTDSDISVDTLAQKNDVPNIVAISSGTIMISTGERTVMTSSLPIVSKPPVVAMPMEKVNNTNKRKTCPEFTTKDEMLADYKSGNTRLDGNGDGNPCTTIKYKE